MQIRTRIIAAVSTVVTLVTLFVTQIANPAHAGGGGGDLDTLLPFNRAGEPHNLVAISITMLILTALVLITAALVSKAFDKK